MFWSECVNQPLLGQYRENRYQFKHGLAEDNESDVFSCLCLTSNGQPAKLPKMKYRTGEYNRQKTCNSDRANSGHRKIKTLHAVRNDKWCM